MRDLLKGCKKSTDYLLLLPSISKNTAARFSRYISNMVAELLAIFGKSGSRSKANDSLNTDRRSGIVSLGPVLQFVSVKQISHFGRR